MTDIKSLSDAKLNNKRKQLEKEIATMQPRIEELEHDAMKLEARENKAAELEPAKRLALKKQRSDLNDRINNLIGARMKLHSELHDIETVILIRQLDKIFGKAPKKKAPKK